MAMIQSNFVDRMNAAESELSALVSDADQLANRLVGYAVEPASDGYADSPTPIGILPEMADRASRMSRRIGDVRRSLARISEALPPDNEKGMSTGKPYA